MLNQKILITALKQIVSNNDLISRERVDKQIVKYFELYPHLPVNTKKVLYDAYMDYFKQGASAVDNDLFINKVHTAMHDLKDRFDDYPKVRDGDETFLRQLANSNAEAFDAILQRSSIPGYEENFSYQIYKENYMDEADYATRDVKVPEDFEDEEASYLEMIDRAFSDGVQYQVDALAEKTLQAYAEEMLEDEV